MATGRGQARDAQSIAPWVAPAAAFSLTVPADSRVAFTADADLYVPVLRPRLVVTDGESAVVDAVTLPPVAGGLTFGVVIRYR